MKKLLVLLMVVTAKFANADMPATHGMLLFGDKQLYASHLPMFHAPHDYQLIMKIELEGYPRSMAAQYYEDVKKSGAKLFTIVPQKMDLTKLIDGTIKKFQADVYDGHFEKGGNNLGPVYVIVKNIVLSKKLDAKESETPNTNIGVYNKHILFGLNGEYFAAHIIEGKPSYDAIYSISQPTVFSLKKSACKGRACASFPTNKILSDLQLPVIASDHTTILPVPTTKGQELGLWNNNASILEVIYAEVDELSH